MSLIQSAQLNGHDPYRYLMDVLERLPTQRASRLEALLPYHWRPDQNRRRSGDSKDAAEATRSDSIRKIAVALDTCGYLKSGYKQVYKPLGNRV